MYKKGGIFLLILVSIIVLMGCIFFREGFENDSPPSAPTPSCKIMFYENSTEPNRTQNLEKLLKHFGYDYKVLGRGQTWSGWYGRAKTYEESLKDLDDDNFVLFCDGRDVLPNEDYKTFIEKAQQLYTGKIIFNAETACCNVMKEFQGTVEEKGKYIEDMKNHFKKIAPLDSPYFYLNFGMMFGRCRDFKELFQVMNIQPDQDDQGLIQQKIVNGNFTNYILDYHNVIFCIMYDGPQWNETEGKYYNPNTKSFPSFFHFPGGTKSYESFAEKMLSRHTKSKALL